MIERRAAVARNVRATMDPTAAAEAAAAWAARVEAAASEEEEEAFEEVVAGASGIVGRFRGRGDFPDARVTGSDGEVSSTSLILMKAGARASIMLKENGS